MSLKDQTAHHDYGDYKYASSQPGFCYNNYYDHELLDNTHCRYAAFDVIALQDVIEETYSHDNTLQNEVLKYGASLCFYSNFVTPLAVNALKKKIRGTYAVQRYV